MFCLEDGPILLILCLLGAIRVAANGNAVKLARVRGALRTNNCYTEGLSWWCYNGEAEEESESQSFV